MNQNPNNLIRPQAGVRLPDNGMGGAPGMARTPLGAGMGQPGMGGMQQPMMGQGMQQMSPGEMIMQQMSSVAANTSGASFNWATYGQSAYEDEGLRALKSSQDSDPDNLKYFIDRAAPAMAEYWRQIYYRTGQLYDQYKNARDSFSADEFGRTCVARQAFIEAVNRQAEFTRVVANTSLPMFGKGVVEKLRNGNKDGLNANEYLELAYVAARNVLFFEFVSWLMRTPQGQQMCRQLPKSILEKFAHLENFKEAAASAYDMFGQTSPYGGLEFKLQETTRPDWNMLYGKNAEMFNHNNFGHNPQQPQVMDDYAYREILELARRKAAGGNSGYQYTNQQQHGLTGDNTVIDWNNQRTDLENLTRQNMKEFNLLRYFHAISKPNHYFIPESDWKQIQHVFRKHAEQGPEETVLPGSFRVVQLDFDGDTGWFSFIVRAEGLTVQTILSNPALLLPLIDNPEKPDYNVVPVPVEDVTSKRNLTITQATVKKLVDIPLIAVKEAIVSNSAGELESTIKAMNTTITKNIQTENAVGFNAVIWDVFNVQAPEERIRLYNDMPFLFKDSGISGEDRPTFFQACNALNTYFTQGIVNPELCNFIDERLTLLVNNWLVNTCGYTPKKGKGTHLSVSSAVRDIRELSEYLKERGSEDDRRELHVTDANSQLIKGLEIFLFNHPYKPALDEDASDIDKMRQDLALVVERQMYIAVVNRRGGPIHTPGEAVIIQRSKYPEYFQLVEAGFETTMGETTPFDTTDRILRFSDSDNMWLFNYSSFDPNTATLRHIATDRPLVLLPQD